MITAAIPLLVGKVERDGRMKGVHGAIQAYAMDVLTRPMFTWAPLPRSLRTYFSFALHSRLSFARLVYVGSPAIFVSVGFWMKVYL